MDKDSLLLFQHLKDGGPRYYETDLSRTVVEPWNATTAALFILIVLYWLLGDKKLRNRPVMLLSIPILAVGGVGGTLYHAFRNSSITLVMDYLPITILTVMASLYFFVKVLPHWWYIFLISGGMALGQMAAFEWLPPAYASNISYAQLAIFILLPMLWYLWKTRFRNAWIVLLSLSLFGMALFFRWADVWRPPLLPMGTHWLWHLFGSLSCHFLLLFVWRVDTPRLNVKGEVYHIIDEITP
jgi:hypothetical protein